MVRVRGRWCCGECDGVKGHVMDEMSAGVEEVQMLLGNMPSSIQPLCTILISEHVERPQRIIAAFETLREEGLLGRCHRLPSHMVRTDITDAGGHSRRWMTL